MSKHVASSANHVVSQEMTVSNDFVSVPQLHPTGKSDHREKQAAAVTALYSFWPPRQATVQGRERGSVMIVTPMRHRLTFPNQTKKSTLPARISIAQSQAMSGQPLDACSIKPPSFEQTPFGSHLDWKPGLVIEDKNMPNVSTSKQDVPF